MSEGKPCSAVENSMIQINELLKTFLARLTTLLVKGIVMYIWLNE
jgi:hypothetical protein